MMKLKQEIKLKDKVERFVFNWHRFPIDYWWRKKYGIPFGSKQHREMNFIDMLIEYREDLIINKAIAENNTEQDRYENEILGLTDDGNEIIKLSDSEISEDYENLDLSQFD